jgi:hypothetical protein
MKKRIDTHRHLGGSVPESFFDAIDLKRLFHDEYRYGVDAKCTFDYFFSRFNCLDLINWTEEKVELLLDHVTERINAEGYRTILSFSVDKYLAVYHNYTDAVFHIADSILDKSQNIKLLLGVKYESVERDYTKLLRALSSSRVTDVISGIDFISDERRLQKPLVVDLLKAMKGKYRRAHVAERQPNIVGIQLLKDGLIDGLAHGIYLNQFEEFYQLVEDNGIFIDMAITSNLATGTISDVSQHPVHDFMKHKCRLTLGTDDPEIFGTNLDTEYGYIECYDWHDRIITNSATLWSQYS